LDQVQPLSRQPTSPVFDPPDVPVVADDAAAADQSAAWLPINDLAVAYQPRRVFAATISIGWNLLLAALFAFSGAAHHLLAFVAPANRAEGAPHFSWAAPVYFGVVFAGYAILNLPLELWFGYLEERRFGLAKDGIRAWARDWVIGTTQHGVMFVTGASLILLCHVLAPGWWLVLVSAGLLALFVGTTYFAADLIPPGLFNIQPADDESLARLGALLPSSGPSLPTVLIYSHSTLREYAGGIVGLGHRQRYLISRSTLASASDGLLRFVILHDLGHRRYHHNLLAALAGWAWVAIGLAGGHLLIPAANFGSPTYVAFLGLTLSVWMAIGEPALAYLGRRLEYQADRFYLRNGGTLDEMRAALSELARRNLARTEPLLRRQTIFHPLPSVSNRLHAASKVAEKSAFQE
jgi:Zn-dependent protease with chaperone function